MTHTVESHSNRLFVAAFNWNWHNPTNVVRFFPHRRIDDCDHVEVNSRVLVYAAAGGFWATMTTAADLEYAQMYQLHDARVCISSDGWVLPTELQRIAAPERAAMLTRFVHAIRSRPPPRVNPLDRPGAVYPNFNSAAAHHGVVSYD